MKKEKSLVVTFICLVCVFVSNASFASLALDNKSSQLSFITTKKSMVAETNTFSEISGEVTDAGDVNIIINLASVDSAIAIRDERMRKFLFETNLFPKAEISARVDMDSLKKMSVGEVASKNIKIALSLHGQTNNMEAKVSVISLKDGGFNVATVSPIMVDAADFKLVKGIEKLREIANLPSISKAVPVMFNFNFK